MAQIFVANVYRINDADLTTTELMGFNPTNVQLRPVVGNVVAGPNSIRMYGKIQSLPRGLVVDNTQYWVIETVLALQTLANA